MTSRRFLFGLVMMALFMGLVLRSVPALAAAASEKIAPRVLTDTANGSTSEALVVLGRWQSPSADSGGV